MTVRDRLAGGGEQCQGGTTCCVTGGTCRFSEHCSLVYHAMGVTSGVAISRRTDDDVDEAGHWQAQTSAINEQDDDDDDDGDANDDE